MREGTVHKVDELQTHVTEGHTQHTAGFQGVIMVV